MFFFKTYSRHTDRIPPGCASCGCDKPDYPRTFAWRHWAQLAWRWGWSGSKLCRESLATADRWGSRTESWHGYPGQGGPSSWLSGWTPCAGRGLGGRWWLHLKDVRKRKRTLEYFSWCSFKAHWFNLKFEFYAPVKKYLEGFWAIVLVMFQNIIKYPDLFLSFFCLPTTRYCKVTSLTACLKFLKPANSYDYFSNVIKPIWAWWTELIHVL